MNASDELSALIVPGRSVRLIEENIYSVLPDTSIPHHYDKRAALYDLVVGTRLYNFVMWETSPRDYIEFAEDALSSCRDELFLDAGCGSLLFTGRLYADASRRIIAIDQSLSMLRRARKRLVKLPGRVPEHIRLVQADLTDLPFRKETFGAVLCLNVLHQFADAPALISRFKELLTSSGNLFLTSLASTDRSFGNWYLNALYRTGEFVRPRNAEELGTLLSEALDGKIHFSVKGNMVFVRTDRK